MAKAPKSAKKARRTVRDEEWIFVFGEAAYLFAKEPAFRERMRADPERTIAELAGIGRGALPGHVGWELRKINWSLTDQQLLRFAKIKPAAW